MHAAPVAHHAVAHHAVAHHGVHHAAAPFAHGVHAAAPLLSPLPTTLLSRDNNSEEEYPKLFISIYEIKIFNTLLLPNFWEYQLKIMVGIYFCIPQLFGTVQLNLQQRLILRELYVFMCLVEGRST